MRSPTRRRETVSHVHHRLGVSERRACRVLDQPRMTQRYGAKVRDDEAPLVRRIHELVRLHPRRGYRMICGMLRLEGWRVNRKRVYRLWRKEGLKVPVKRHKKRHLGLSENGVVRHRAESINDVWCWDFIQDRDERGRMLKWLVITDEFTREGLALEVRRSIKAEDVLDVLSELMLTRGAPRHIRSDNGPEFIAAAIRRFLGQVGVETLYIEPGSPWQNAYAESFNSRLRDELLGCTSFADRREAEALGSWWRNDYNHRRPHSSLGYRTPAAFASSLRPSALRVGASPLPSAPPASATDQPKTLIHAGT